jgi:nucleoside-diphosphate-sugar epimerase
MSHPILVTGATCGTQGSTGRLITSLLLEQGIPVRALVHKLDSRSDGLRQQGAEVVEGDLLNPASVQAAMRNVKRAYFTYPLACGLLEAATILAAALLANRGMPSRSADALVGKTPTVGEMTEAPEALEEFFPEDAGVFIGGTEEA